MQRLILLQPTPKDPEIAVVRVSGKEHSTLHTAAGLDLLNSNHVFSKPARTLKMSTCAHPDVGCLVVLPHPLPCNAVGFCVAA